MNFQEKQYESLITFVVKVEREREREREREGERERGSERLNQFILAVHYFSDKWFLLARLDSNVDDGDGDDGGDDDDDDHDNDGDDDDDDNEVDVK